MMEALFGRRVPGFPETAESVERYERQSGYQVRDPRVARDLRAGAGARHQRPPPEDSNDRRRTENPMAGVLLDRLEAVAR